MIAKDLNRPLSQIILANKLIGNKIIFINSLISKEN